MKSPQSRRSTLLQGLALTVCLLTAGAGSAWADGLDDVVKAGTIKIGIFEDFPPFASLGSDMVTIDPVTKLPARPRLS